MIFAKFVWKLHSHCCRVVIRSATIEEIEAEKSAIEKDVVRAFFWLSISGYASECYDYVSFFVQ